MMMVIIIIIMGYEFIWETVEGDQLEEDGKGKDTEG
jgi:hypothetical protein